MISIGGKYGNGNGFAHAARVRQHGANGRSSGKFQYNIVFNKLPSGTSNFYQEILTACKEIVPRFNPPTGKPKITFAVIKEGGNYDNLPELPFLKEN